MTSDLMAPISKYYPVPLEFRDLSLLSLKTIALDDEKYLMDRAIRAIMRSGHITIGQVLGLTLFEFGNIRGFGAVGEDIMLEAFQRIINDPGAFASKNKSELIKARMRERGYII